MIMRLVYFFAWLRSRDETKIKNQSKQNKYADPGYRRTMYNCRKLSYDNKMPPKKARSEKNKPKISFFTTSEKENPWSEDETDTGTTTEANEATSLLFRLITFAGWNKN
jgi:hypothetical protein